MEQVQSNSLRVSSPVCGSIDRKADRVACSTDNPPPKVVHGYKVCFNGIISLYLSLTRSGQFNIFYPYLIDKSKAPTYKIVKEEGNDDTVLLHFTAGPPYEDIAFRIVNREWEFSHKRFVLAT